MPRLLTAVLAALLLAPLSSRAEEGTIVVALVPEQNVFLQMKRFRPLQDYLTASTGSTYRFAIMSSYHEAFESLSNGKAQAAFLGSMAAFLSIEQRSGELVCRPLWQSGVSTYRALIIARKDAGVRKITDLKGKRYAFTNPLASAGWLFDRWAFVRAGIRSPESYLGETVMAGSHDVVINAVYMGEVTAGGCKEPVWERMKKEIPDLEEKVGIIATSRSLPDSNLVVSTRMPAAQRSVLRDRVFSMHTRQDGKEALEEMGILRFIPTGISDFDYLRGLFSDMRVNPRTYRIPVLPAP